ncbi:hypothetical protein [Brevibacillus borstelensis]|uniref:hypothetical protein n=1 Tax=Brevibacillus borstelensis TaxID=45462 RepID=UPI000469CCD8|nr:hypothetical protein [Brevibacillus borstelensis]
MGTWKGSKWRRFVSYLAYSIFCGILILQMLRVQVLLQEQVRVTFKSMPLLVYSAFFPVIIGILLGIPGFVRTCRQPAAWSFDWVKFIAVGVFSESGTEGCEAERANLLNKKQMPFPGGTKQRLTTAEKWHTFKIDI